MPLSQQYLTTKIPMGANLRPEGATFRVWAPKAQGVHLLGNFQGSADWTPGEHNRLIQDTDGYWAGFVPGVKEGDQYIFYVYGTGSEGKKRDPCARELTDDDPAYPWSNCIVRSPSTYPWHDQGFRPPPFHELVIYQFHVGTFFGPERGSSNATYLDILDRLDYLVDLGITALEPLPVVEFVADDSMGYDGSDFFSPEMDYGVLPGDLAPYLDRVNDLLARRHHPPLTFDQLAVPINQLKAFIDVCHVYGLAVILDVVYNHAGSQLREPVHDESIYFFDRQERGDENRSQFFIDRDHCGPIFAFWKQEVRQFLIDNASFFVEEYHADGFRYDQVSVIVENNVNDGWRFCQDLTDTVRSVNPGTVHIAEYWNVDPGVTRSRSELGAGFDATWHDGIRTSIRATISQAAGGRDSRVDLDRVAWNLYPGGFPAAWKAVQCLENHDEVKVERNPRIARLGDYHDARSWYARSRARVATGLLLTAPGIPMLFMGQEFLEDKQWSDNPEYYQNTLIWWEGLEGGDKVMGDFHVFSRELTWLRRRHPALCGEGFNLIHVHNDNRILAFQRWQEGVGRDVVVVASLNESTFYNYQLGFPRPGRWLEVFNSDVYDNWVNPWVAGNGGIIEANGPPWHDLPHSAWLVIPANSILVFALDPGN
jgi:1,4-alpha-glucan branching enzyme